jgi:hypothetical protein
MTWDAAAYEAAKKKEIEAEVDERTAGRHLCGGVRYVLRWMAENPLKQLPLERRLELEALCDRREEAERKRMAASAETTRALALPSEVRR